MIRRSWAQCSQSFQMSKHTQPGGGSRGQPSTSDRVRALFLQWSAGDGAPPCHRQVAHQPWRSSLPDSMLLKLLSECTSDPPCHHDHFLWPPST
jgi:hypothetical protein